MITTTFDFRYPPHGVLVYEDGELVAFERCAPKDADAVAKRLAREVAEPFRSRFEAR